MSATTLLNQALAMQTASGNTSDIDWGDYTELALDILINDKQGTSPTLKLILERIAADGLYYAVWNSITYDVSAADSTNIRISTSIGVGLDVAQSFGSTGRLRWVIGGSSTPGAKFSLSLIGK